jgi:hypothetical protein
VGWDGMLEAWLGLHVRGSVRYSLPHTVIFFGAEASRSLK